MRLRGYPIWFFNALMVVVSVLLLSGMLIMPTTLELKLEWEMPWRLTGDSQIAMAALHAGVSFLFTATVGAIWSVHMRAGWKRRKNHRTGLALLTSLLLLGISAIGIYYLAEEQSALFSSLIHIVGGALMPLLLAVHIVAGRQTHAG